MTFMRAGQPLQNHYISPIRKEDIIVDTTSDSVDFLGMQQLTDLPGTDGKVTLREAIIASNNTPGRHQIAFRIPTDDPGFDGFVFKIEPLENVLPPIIGDGLIIDGSTQTAYSGDTNEFGPEIVLDGILVTDEEPYGLEIKSADNHIHALAIYRFRGAIDMNSPSAFNNVITGCILAADESGVSYPSGSAGVACRTGASFNIIGGSRQIDRNVIYGNGVGVFLSNEEELGTTGNSIIGNFIGSDISGVFPMGNLEGMHIKCGVSDTMIKDNLIAYNIYYGIMLDDAEYPNGPYSTGNTISRNSIFFNYGERGIVFIGYPDINDPGDLDIGTNNLMNSPELISASIFNQRLVIEGVIDTIHPSTVVIEFFANPIPFPGADPSGYGEGAVFIGKKKPNSKGQFKAVLPYTPIGTPISATATDADGNTSLFAANIEVN